MNFMGTTGPQGPLPHFYTTLILSRLRSGDKTLRDFLDLFHHRMLSFFYQAWEKYRFAVSYDRGERDRFSQLFARSDRARHRWIAGASRRS